MTLSKKLAMVVASFFILVALVFVYVYFSKVNALKEEFEHKNATIVEYIVATLQDKIPQSSSKEIDNILQHTINTSDIEHIRLQYQTTLFTKANLILNSNYSKSLNWEVSDVTTDASNGFVKLLNNNAYRLYPNAALNIQEPITFKFFLYQNQNLINTTSVMRFFYEQKALGIDEQKIQNSAIKRTAMLYFLNEPLAQFEYVINDTSLQEQIQSLFNEYIYYYSLLFVLGLIAAAILYYIFIQKMLLEPIRGFKASMKEALENNFMQKMDKKVGNEDVNEALDLLNIILKKYVTVVNELNINKSILERKVFTDDLTGLPNQKVFELDLKNMFIVGTDGFIGSIKLDALGAFTQKNGSALANHLIEEFTHTVQNKFYEWDFHEATLYRFFGSEFAMIVKNEKEEALSNFSQALQEELIELQMRYEIEAQLCYFSFVPFDKYGTIDSILHSASDAYHIAKSKEEAYHIVSPTEVLDKFQHLESSVRDIIENSSFEITFGFETRTCDEDKLIMKEAMPILYDNNGEKFSIGVFISVAEKINLASNFDKIIIQNVIRYIQNNEIDYNIAINLSMQSLNDSEFINWLHSLFVYNAQIAQHIVFSLTSYNASTNIEVFKNFTHEIHRFNAKMILKRFSSNDFTIEQLEEFALDYLRINKDYTTGISKDRDKKHFLRTVVNFGQSNDIIVIGDSIKDEKDIQICTNIGLDAVSNF
jgi:EAL domain-containing protein (putative c-di-GMP-specific phosphodiesterase class I)/GGDEF domain-containing protein